MFWDEERGSRLVGLEVLGREAIRGSIGVCGRGSGSSKSGFALLGT